MPTVKFKINEVIIKGWSASVLVYLLNLFDVGGAEIQFLLGLGVLVVLFRSSFVRWSGVLSWEESP